jgi:hypothetical protein
VGESRDCESETTKEGAYAGKLKQQSHGLPGTLLWRLKFHP